VTVVTVDWGDGSGFPYSQASANTRVVGAEIVRLINFLGAHAGLSVDKVHIIGHSLGAHVAGYAGAAFTSAGLHKIARITGMLIISSLVQSWTKHVGQIFLAKRNNLT
jgi:pancreatic triacylglycerol lipase